jgi:Arc/MetJ-type ribon-helix-helix transcriptional regulator
MVLFMTTSVTLPHDLEAWARAEVAAGRAESVEALVADALRERQKWDDFRRSLDQAEAEADAGGRAPAEDVFADLKARYPVE